MQSGDKPLENPDYTAMRVCWNRQTGTFEGRVSKDVWVQVPLLAPMKETSEKEVSFLLHKFKKTNPLATGDYFY